MKKLREWFKIRRNAYIAMQTSNALVFALSLFQVVALPYSVSTIVNAALAGFCAAMFFANQLIHRLQRVIDDMIEIATGQNDLLNEMAQIKTREIAAELAGQMGGEVRVMPQSPPPTKH